MRPIRLDIAAFGPFPGTEVIDFASLPTDQPFVISGPTGAGKTSIFDAMCLALFGGLPGARSNHTEVRSTFAPSDAACEVTFEFALGDQRLTVWRAPTQTRAKVRGNGTTTTQARATLHRLDGGEWVPLASKVSEVNRLVPELLGITAELFQRSVLLPQGEFHRALRANSTERAGLLRALFGTQVFADATERVGRERKDLSAVLAEADTEARTLLEQVAKRLDTALAELEGRGPGRGQDGAGDPGADTVARGEGVGNVGLGDDHGKDDDGAYDDGAYDDGADDDGAYDDGAYDDAQVIDLTDRAQAGAGSGPDADGLAIDPGALRAEAERLGGAALTHLEAESREAATAAAGLRAEHARAEQVATDVRRRDDLAARVAAGEAGADDRAAERSRLERAEAAAGVVAAADRHHTAQQAQLAATDARAEAWDAAASAASAAGVALDHAAAGRLPDEEGAAEAAALADTAAEAARRQADTLTRARQDLTEAAEQRSEAASAAQSAAAARARVAEFDADIVATTTRIDEARDAGREAQRLAGDLPAAEQDESRVRGVLGAATELQAARVDLVRARTQQAYGRVTLAAASRAVAIAELARDAAPAAAADLDGASATHREAEAIVADLDELLTLRAKLPELQRHAEAARATADAAVRAFADGAAPRLAEGLRPGEPCAVCGSTEHPAPATADEGRPPVGIGEVETAQQRAERAGGEAGLAGRETTRLLTRRPELRDLDPAAARAELLAASARVRAAEDAEASSADAQAALERTLAARDDALAAGDLAAGAVADSGPADGHGSWCPRRGGRPLRGAAGGGAGGVRAPRGRGVGGPARGCAARGVGPRAHQAPRDGAGRPGGRRSRRRPGRRGTGQLRGGGRASGVRGPRGRPWGRHRGRGPHRGREERRHPARGSPRRGHSRAGRAPQPPRLRAGAG